MQDEGRDPATDEELRFAELIRNISAAVSGATRELEQLPALSDSHVVAMRALVRTGGLTPTQLATELGLSRPTISEVVRRLEDEDLVVRRRSKQDGRSGVFTPTERAQHVLDAFRRGRVHVLVTALRALEPDDRTALLAQAEALDHLLGAVTDEAERVAAERAPASA